MEQQLTKKAIRKAMLQLRRNLKYDDKAHRDHLIYQRTLAFLIKQNPKNILMYWPTENEVDTIALIDTLISLNIAVYLPSINPRNQMTIIQIKSTNFEYEYWKSIRQPKIILKNEAKVNFDIIIVPLIAYDARMVRIGFGLGHYDRFLKNQPITSLKLGLAYNFQKMHHIPSETHDVSLNVVINESTIEEKKD